MMQSKIKPEIRRLAPADLSQILAIERMSFPDPWTVESFRGILQIKTYLALGAFDNNLLGYIICSKVVDELHILNIAVAENVRRRGVANALIEKVLGLYPGQLKYVYLEVRENNIPAIKFYLKLGFEKVGSRTRYYPDGSDAILMTLFL